MAVYPLTPYQTTLNGAIDASQMSIKTVASTGFVDGWYVVIGREVMLITKANTTTHTHEVRRGMKGSAAKAHRTGVPVTAGPATTFGSVTKDGNITLTGYTGNYTAPLLPLGSRWIDPDTGYEYVCANANQAFTIGSWVHLAQLTEFAQVNAVLLTNALKGRVGIVVETGTVSSATCWVMVVGTYSAALFAHTKAPVTTGTLLTASGSVPGALGCPTTCDLQQTRVFGATCTVALTTGSCPITDANPGTAYINNPWTHGVVEKGTLYTA